MVTQKSLTMATPKSLRPDSFATRACGRDLPGSWLHTGVGLDPVHFQVACLNQSSFPLQHQLSQLLKKALKILHLDTAKKVMPKGCQLDSFVTGACSPYLRAPWLHTSVGLTSVLFQFTYLSLISLSLQHQLCQLIILTVDC